MRTDLTALDLIAAERQRQIEAEGRTPEHDAEHSEEELAFAAVCYAMPSTEQRLIDMRGTPRWWPWERRWWKPTPDDRVRELVKAGALIAAEIDRLQTRMGSSMTAAPTGPDPRTDAAVGR